MKRALVVYTLVTICMLLVLGSGTVFAAGCCSNNQDEQGKNDLAMDMNHDHLKMQHKEVTAEKTKVYTEVWGCSMNDYRGEKTKDGKCPKCGMKLEKVIVTRELKKDEVGKEYVCPVTKESFKGSTVNKAAEYKGKTYYFCCNECPDKFVKNPEKYVKDEDKHEKNEKGMEHHKH